MGVLCLACSRPLPRPQYRPDRVAYFLDLSSSSEFEGNFFGVFHYHLNHMAAIWHYSHNPNASNKFSGADAAKLEEAYMKWEAAGNNSMTLLLHNIDVSC